MISTEISNLNNFRKIKDIINNKYASVTLVEDINSNNKYIVTTLSRKCESEQDQKLFLTKISRISRISRHPSVLSIYGFCVNDFNNQPFPTIITEYLPNGTLGDLFKDDCPANLLQSFTPTKKFINFVGIAVGLRHLHFNYIQHGDLHPGYIVMDANFYPHIFTDGVSAKIYDHFPYSKKVEFEANDVFSFSLIAYELISGRKPIITEQSIPDISLIKSQYIRTFLQKCWSSKIYDRPKFTAIIDEIIDHKEEFYSEFGNINKDEVTIYFNFLRDHLVQYSKHFKEAADRDNIVAILMYGRILYNGYGVQTNKAEAAKYFKKAADRGSVVAMNSYGNMLSYGNGVPKDLEQAAHYYKMASDKGSIVSTNSNDEASRPDIVGTMDIAQGNINDNAESFNAMCHSELALDGGEENVLKEKEKMVSYCKMLADKGDTDMMNNYAIMLQQGEEVPADNEEAARYFKMAVDRGNVLSMHNYAVMLEDDEEKSMVYYKMAADKGHPESINRYGQYLYDVKEDPVKAAKYFKTAADKGITDAMFNYAVIVDQGIGLDQNKFDAAKYYKMAADKGHQDAMFNYAMMLENGDGIETDKKEALKYYKAAADNGNENAMFNYGCMLITGDGIEPNYEEAVKYFKMGADNQNVASMFNLAVLLYKGEKVERDKKLASHYYKTAAYLGDTDSMNNLGSMLRDGDGVDCDKKEAAFYFKTAADLGHPFAMFNYANMALTGDGIDPDEEEAANYFKLAADCGHPEAMYIYAKMLNEGNGVERNLVEAMNYFKLAAEHGVENAENDYQRLSDLLDFS